MASKYIIFQDTDGAIKVRRRLPFGLKVKVRDHSGSSIGPFGTEREAESRIESIEKRKVHDARARRAAIEDSGVKYVFQCANDEDLTIKNQFRIVRTDKVEDKPFYIQELTGRGWVNVCTEYDSFTLVQLVKCGKVKRYSSLAFAKTDLLAMVQKLQEQEDRRKRARVLKVIDAKVYDHSEENELASAS